MRFMTMSSLHVLCSQYRQVYFKELKRTPGRTSPGSRQIWESAYSDDYGSLHQGFLFAQLRFEQLLLDYILRIGNRVSSCPDATQRLLLLLLRSAADQLRLGKRSADDGGNPPCIFRYAEEN